MPHQDDLAVIFFQLFQRLIKPLLKLFPQGRGSGGQLLVAQLGTQVQR